MPENPYQPTITSTPNSTPSIPHTASIRSEAWRGAKFGAKITAYITSAIAIIVGLGLFFVAVNAIIQTNGAILERVSWLETIKGIGGAFFSILLMSFYGGIAGSILMALASVIRKNRNQKPRNDDCK